MHIRQTKLLDIVNRERKVSVSALAKQLDVSEVTIRKDLTSLEQKGMLHREHGYAVMSADDDVLHQLSFNYERKHHIAEQAAESIENGETIMLSSGACCALLAEEIALHKNDVTIITNSAFLAGFVRKYPNAHVILFGGEYQNDAQVLVGPLIKDYASHFSVDKIFVNPDGFSEKGFMGADLMRAEAIRAIAESASQIIVLAESATLNRKSHVLTFTLDEVQRIYTDDVPTGEVLACLEQHGIEIKTTPPPHRKQQKQKIKPKTNQELSCYNIRS